eukprot:CAMPEP_0204382134 /NCGR_PEP_ID=MMETSP0469-20131031/54850_1 /ASSEMBLY_ACC=CAM_ASM_000384 /TAXON_ID=2969 /ORGANISM="Oxyrrhis marina" /LENGTH=136 /DNA_ID=CAMNT_0051374137 /DNA_START=174 /DNA_END=585 /DNA_ORIENTATION=-
MRQAADRMGQRSKRRAFKLKPCVLVSCKPREQGPQPLPFHYPVLGTCGFMRRSTLVGPLHVGKPAVIFPMVSANNDMSAAQHILELLYVAAQDLMENSANQSALLGVQAELAATAGGTSMVVCPDAVFWVVAFPIA